MSDLIKREDALKAIDYRRKTANIDSRIVLDEVEDKIRELPSADRPSGEWIIRENGNNECSLCGHERQDGWDYFCGYCGAKMRSGGLYYADDKYSVEWKPVSDGTPQSVGIYIVTCKDEYGSVYVDYDFWTVLDEFKYNCDKVTAWIPFPKPYCGTKMKGEK